MTARTDNNPWLSRFAIATTLATLFLICIGGLVTSHEAGMAVPDWPTTYGYNMFFFPFSKWVGGIFYEHSHRLVASGVGFMTIVLALGLWLRESRSWVRWLGVIALMGVIGQGVLGGLRVTESMPELGIFHAALAQLFLALVAAIALFTSPWWRETRESVPQAGELRPYYSWISALIFLQLMVAATMRHQHAGLAITDFPLAYGQLWPDMSSDAMARYNQVRAELHINPATPFQIGLQMVHRLLAVGISVFVFAFAWRTVARIGWRAPLSKLCLLQAGLIITQVLLGAATIWTNKSADITTAHVAVGALIFLVSVILVLVSTRHMLGQLPEAERSNHPASSSPVFSA